MGAPERLETHPLLPTRRLNIQRYKLNQRVAEAVVRQKLKQHPRKGTV